MINQQVLSGKWQEVRGALKAKWGKLTDDDTRLFNGNVDQLIGRIQEKTGESRESIEKYLDQLTDETSDFLSGLRNRVEEGASNLANGARQGVDVLKHGVEESGRLVQERPGQSIAVAFTLGVASGVGLALLLRERPRATAYARGRAVTEQYGHQLVDKLNSLLADLKRSVS